MKKLIALLLAVTVLFSIVAAAPIKLVRLEVINQSGDTVYLKLQGTVTDEFYYLTIPNSDEPKLYTIATDLYKRTTTACGYTNTGKLNMTSNLRLKFTPCETMPNKRVVMPNGKVDCRLLDSGLWSCDNYGEPTMEKVTYYKTTIGGVYHNGICGGWVKIVMKRSPYPGLCYFRYRY